MSINSITITQDNKVNGSDLLPVHSPLIFLVDVDYTDTVPDVLFVEIRDSENTVLETYRAIAYQDPLTTLRTFAFKAGEAIRSLMGVFDDQFQNLNTLEFIENITKVFKLRFVDPDNSATYDELTATFLHGASQFSEYPNKESIYNNDSISYFGAKDGFTYVYFYNNDTTNNLTISVS